MTQYKLLLFVTGSSDRSKQAEKILRDACDRTVKGLYELELINVLEEPFRAEEYRILATPTLVREFPLPRKRIIGDLSDEGALVEAMELRSRLPLTFVGTKDAE